MRQNFWRDKMRKEELRKKKQEEKRNKRLNKKEPASQPEPMDSGHSDPASSFPAL
jgi:hypothetical protein